MDETLLNVSEAGLTHILSNFDLPEAGRLLLFSCRTLKRRWGDEMVQTYFLRKFVLNANFARKRLRQKDATIRGLNRDIKNLKLERDRLKGPEVTSWGNGMRTLRYSDGTIETVDENGVIPHDANW